MEAHQRPELERYGDTLFVVLRAARYLDASEEVDFGELHVFVGPDFVITVRHGAAPDLPSARHVIGDVANPVPARPSRRLVLRSCARPSAGRPGVAAPLPAPT